MAALEASHSISSNVMSAIQVVWQQRKHPTIAIVASHSNSGNSTVCNGSTRGGMAAKETSHDSNSGIPPLAIDLCVMAAMEASHKGGGVVAKDPPS